MEAVGPVLIASTYSASTGLPANHAHEASTTTCLLPLTQLFHVAFVFVIGLLDFVCLQPLFILPLT
jgi:hypothetical protein